MKTVILFGRSLVRRRNRWFGLRRAWVAGGVAVGQLPRSCEPVPASERAGLLALTRGSLTLASDIDMLEEFAYLNSGRWEDPSGTAAQSRNADQVSTPISRSVCVSEMFVNFCSFQTFSREGIQTVYF